VRGHGFRTELVARLVSKPRNATGCLTSNLHAALDQIDLKLEAV